MSESPKPLAHQDAERKDDDVLAREARTFLLASPTVQLIAELLTKLREADLSWWSPQVLREAWPAAERMRWLAERPDIRQRITTALTGLAPKAARKKPSDFQAALIDSVVDDGDTSVRAFEEAFSPVEMAVYGPVASFWRAFRERFPWDDRRPAHRELVAWLMGALLNDKSFIDDMGRAPVMNAWDLRTGIDNRAWHANMPIDVRAAIDDARLRREKVDPGEPFHAADDLAIALPETIAAHVPLRDLRGVLDVAERAMGLGPAAGASAEAAPAAGPAAGAAATPSRAGAAGASTPPAGTSATTGAANPAGASASASTSVAPGASPAGSASGSVGASGAASGSGPTSGSGSTFGSGAAGGSGSFGSGAAGGSGSFGSGAAGGSGSFGSGATGGSGSGSAFGSSPAGGSSSAFGSGTTGGSSSAFGSGTTGGSGSAFGGGAASGSGSAFGGGAASGSGPASGGPASPTGRGGAAVPAASPSPQGGIELPSAAPTGPAALGGAGSRPGASPKPSSDSPPSSGSKGDQGDQGAGRTGVREPSTSPPKNDDDDADAPATARGESLRELAAAAVDNLVGVHGLPTLFDDVEDLQSFVEIDPAEEIEQTTTNPKIVVPLNGPTRR